MAANYGMGSAGAGSLMGKSAKEGGILIILKVGFFKRKFRKLKKIYRPVRLEMFL